MNNTAGSAPRQMSSMYMSNMLSLDRVCWNPNGSYSLCVFVRLFHGKTQAYILNILD